jgi:transcriptional regulator with XRE-family HTH domain
MPRSVLSREERSSLLALRREHGLTYAELGRVAGIAAGTLQQWARRERLRLGPAVPMRFAEVVLGDAAPSRGSFEIEARGGRRVRVPPDFDAAALVRLLETLDGPC